jgi:hypothetical protein
VPNLGIAKIGAVTVTCNSRYKAFEVEIVDRFPLTGSGKVQKFKQKAYAVEKYHLEEPGG